MQLRFFFHKVKPLRPFFSYYGAKWNLARKYPRPCHATIVEPFAGSAAYALHHPAKKVMLFDLDENIALIWSYLISVSEAEVRSLPLIAPGQHVEELGLTEEARTLVGFWLNKASSRPCSVPSAWMRRPCYANQFWGVRVRERIASQLQYIRHWSITHGSYQEAPAVEATWFIDPPYQQKGVHYNCGSHGIDYPSLAQWCTQRPGQVIVCEQEGADWLPFKPFHSVAVTTRDENNPGSKRRSREVIALYGQRGVI